MKNYLPLYPKSLKTTILLIFKGDKMGEDENKGRLIMFTGTECDHCHANEPTVEKVEKELNVKFERLEVWHNAENAAFLEKTDKNPDGSTFCGGIPFFYNEKTGKKLCGPQKYEKLKALVENKEAA